MKILYFDVAAAVILLVLFMSLFLYKMTSGRANKYFMLLLCQIFITTIFDFWSESYNIWLTATASNAWLREFLYGMYFLCRALTQPLYLLFLSAVTDTWHILRKNRLLKGMLIIPIALCFCTILTNPIHHLAFYFDDAYRYNRGPLIGLFYVIAFLHMLLGVCYLIYYRKQLTSDKFFALLMMYPLNLLTVIIQLFRPEYLLEMFMTTISMLIITISVQRLGQTVHPVLGVRNYTAYTTDIHKACAIEKPMRIFYLKIVNYNSLCRLFEYERLILLIKKITVRLQDVRTEQKFPLDIYYLENGLFTFVTEQEISERLYDTAQRLNAVLTEITSFEQIELKLETCACIVSYPQDINNDNDLLTFGNTFASYLPHGQVNEFGKIDKQNFRLYTNLDLIISRAVAQNRFEMYYQPIYSVQTGTFQSAEALIRLRDEDYGFISPELFIPAAEKNGMILQIGDFVLEDVCRFLADCTARGLGLSYIELNLSMAQCMREDLVKKVSYYLGKYNLRPEQLNLEITETAVNTAQDVVERNIHRLVKKGLHFSLDDYGTGYSNISRIAALPFRIIKLDKSLADRVNEPRMNILLRNTVHMLKELGMEIVVEGVETEETLRQFCDFGCDFIQGYYFSRPLPEQEFVDFINARRK